MSDFQSTTRKIDRVSATQKLVEAQQVADTDSTDESATSQSPAPRYMLESVNNVLRLLLMFRRTSQIRLSDAKEELGVGHSTVHRLLAMLVYHGFVTQDPVSRIYKPGNALVEVGLAAVQRMDIRTIARPVLEELAAETGETVQLAIFEDGNVRYIDAIESSQALRVSVPVGKVFAAYASSAGKAILAELPIESVRAMYPRGPLQSFTSNTITQWLALEEELEEVRKRGYATNFEESQSGVCSVATAIRHPTRGLVAALGISAPVTRMNPKQVRRLSELVIDGAERVASSLVK
ncbi:IclR family acetate operon transcriptional repressor [Paraburkholderia sp. RAU6.4a]|uniref:IclR family transcriptional regulator n=1 Tax=Paraburkholderia sp. RAU6.4a TaxID=2991067 RepID=UPI003D22341B